MFRNTKSLLWISLALILAGCGSPEDVLVGPTNEAPQQSVKEDLNWGDAASEPSEVLKIFRAAPSDDEAGSEITVGESLEETKISLARPARAYGSPKRPVTLGQQFSVWGWETDGESVGVISYDSKTAMVLLIYDQVDDDFVAERLQELTQYNGSPVSSVEHKTCRYEFWERGGHRMMLCVSKSGQDSQIVSIALGQGELMDFMRMSMTYANIDGREADALWNKRAAATDSAAAASE